MVFIIMIYAGTVTAAICACVFFRCVTEFVRGIAGSLCGVSLLFVLITGVGLIAESLTVKKHLTEEVKSLKALLRQLGQ